MIKKIAVLSLLFPLSALAASANNFDGAYIGAQVGGINGKFNVDQAAAMGNSQPGVGSSLWLVPSEQALYDSSAIGGFHLGYSHVFAQYFFIAAEGRANLDKLEVNNYSSTFASNNSVEEQENLSLQQNTYVKLDNEFDLVAKPGFLLGQKSLFYGTIGVAFGNFTATTQAQFSDTLNIQEPPFFTFNGSSNGSTGAHDSRYKTGLLVGGGIEEMVLPQVSVNLEYDFVNYGNVFNLASASPTQGNMRQGTLAAASKIDVKTNEVTVGASYHFA